MSFFKQDASEWVQIYSDKLGPDGSPPRSYESYWREYDIDSGLELQISQFEKKNEKGETVIDDRLELHCSKHRSNSSPRILFFKTALGITRRPHLHGHGDKGNINLKDRKEEDCCIGLDFKVLPKDTPYPENTEIKAKAINESLEEKIWMRKLKENTVKLLYHETNKEHGIFSKANPTLRGWAETFVTNAQNAAVQEVVNDMIRKKKLDEKEINGLSEFKLKKMVKSKFEREFEEKSLDLYVKGSRVQPVPWDAHIDEKMSEDMIEKEKTKIADEIKQIKNGRPNEKLSRDEREEVKKLGKKISAFDRTFYADRRLYRKDFRKFEEIPEEEKKDEHYILGHKYNPAIIYQPKATIDKKTGQLGFSLKKVDIKPGEYGNQIVTPNSIVQLNLIARPMISRDSYGLAISLVSTMLWYRAEIKDFNNEEFSAPLHMVNFYRKQEMIKNFEKSKESEADDMERELEDFYDDGEGGGKNKTSELGKDKENGSSQNKKRSIKVTIPENIEDEEEDEPPRKTMKRVTRNTRRR